MSYWQITVVGENFERQGKVQSFELTGFIAAESPGDAFVRIIALAKKLYPELRQAECSDLPRATINPAEIQEVSMQPLGKTDTLEICWF